MIDTVHSKAYVDFWYWLYLLRILFIITVLFTDSCSLLIATQHLNTICCLSLIRKKKKTWRWSFHCMPTIFSLLLVIKRDHLRGCHGSSGELLFWFDLLLLLFVNLTRYQTAFCILIPTPIEYGSCQPHYQRFFLQSMLVNTKFHNSPNIKNEWL